MCIVISKKKSVNNLVFSTPMAKLQCTSDINVERKTRKTEIFFVVSLFKVQHSNEVLPEEGEESAQVTAVQLHMEMATIRAMRASAWFVKVLTEINGSVCVCERAHPGMAPEYIRPSARAQQSASCGGGEPWRAAEPSAHVGRFLVACRCLRDS